MKAIIKKILTSQGERISLMGYGDTESIARVGAFEKVNGGPDGFNTEYTGGEVVEISKRLESLMALADDWDDVYDQNGGLVESERPDAARELEDAIGNLVIADDELNFKF